MMMQHGEPALDVAADLLPASGHDLSLPTSPTPVLQRTARLR